MIEGAHQLIPALSRSERRTHARTAENRSVELRSAPAQRVIVEVVVRAAAVRLLVAGARPEARRAAVGMAAHRPVPGLPAPHRAQALRAAAGSPPATAAARSGACSAQTNTVHRGLTHSLTHSLTGKGSRVLLSVSGKVGITTAFRQLAAQQQCCTVDVNTIAEVNQRAARGAPELIVPRHERTPRRVAMLGQFGRERDVPLCVPLLPPITAATRLCCCGDAQMEGSRHSGKTNAQHARCPYGLRAGGLAGTGGYAPAPQLDRSAPSRREWTRARRTLHDVRHVYVAP